MDKQNANPARKASLPLNALLATQVATIPMTWLLLAANVLVFIAMLTSGAGLWHSSNAVQLAWGANFGPATQDGEWWRLASALFLHFGLIHLLMNMAALLDGGRLVERMYGHWRFLLIYFVSGLNGNLLSLVMQGNSAVSGGASGAIFGIYGSLLVFLWRERSQLEANEFRWMFWGAVVFSTATIGLGFVIPGIDNSAHIGGFIAGLLCGIVVCRHLHSLNRQPSRDSIKDAIRADVPMRVAAATTLLVSVAIMIINIPQPPYRWSDELTVRRELSEFVRTDQAANRNWLDIVNDSKQSNASFDALASRIDQDITDQYETSFEQLSELPLNPALPSAKALESTLLYAQDKRDAARALAEKLRAKASNER